MMERERFSLLIRESRKFAEAEEILKRNCIKERERGREI
jgi:hypothetical protein